MVPRWLASATSDLPHESGDPRALPLRRLERTEGNLEAAERRRSREVHIGDFVALAAGHEPVEGA